MKLNPEMIGKIEIFNVAVLRAVFEGKNPGTYFGSLAGLKHWIDSTQNLGWINKKGKITSLGEATMWRLDFSKSGGGRAYLWPDYESVLRKAKAVSWYFLEDFYTPWFPITVPPAYDGRYQVQERTMPCNCCWVDLEFRKGEWFGPVSSNPSVPYSVCVFPSTLRRWRGLSVNPNFT